tara:strand:+ start:179 stop:289 length:111 start_codon:yes stop_codon:yes gene_type:complete
MLVAVDDDDDDPMMKTRMYLTQTNEDQKSYIWMRGY